MNIVNIYENYNSYFSQEFKEIFELCSKVAEKNDYKIFLIGGLVRDMLLNRKSLDIDITVEGDAIEFGHVLERECGAKILSVHESFGTIKVELSGQKIDFASTRSESYPKAGHLPSVAQIGCLLEKDVLRRDFTVNSLAMSLNQGTFADLIDYVGGFEDLKNKKIRILHDKSFIDDPTRIIRALKYSTRLGFELDELTLKLQEVYLQNINYDMCYKRVKQEIKKTFEDCKQDTFDRFIEHGIYKLITRNNQISRHAELVPSSCCRVEMRLTRESIACDVSASCEGAESDRSRNEFGMTLKGDIENLIKKYKPKHCWLIYLGVIMIDENVEKLELTKAEKEVIEGVKSLIKEDFQDDFDLYKAFCAQKTETLLILAALGREKEVFHYLNDLQKIKLQITGKDLLALGYAPSKFFSEGFDYVLSQKLKTPDLKKSEEIKLIKDYLNSING